MGKTIGKFKYRLALDPRLLGRIIDESPTVHAKIEALRKWATYGNKRLVQLQNAPVSEVARLQDGTEGTFILEGGSQATPYGPFPRPICGTPNSRDGLVCLNPRGMGSKHVGKGSCYACEMKKSSSLWRSGYIYKPGNEAMIGLNRANNLPARLRECLDMTDKLEQKTIRAIDEDLKTFYGLVQFVLEGGLHHHLTDEQREEGNWLTEEDIKTCNVLMKSVLEAKKIGYLMDRDAKLDPVTIKSFVGQVMAVVFAAVEPNTARRIGAEILDQVIRPFRVEGRIGGGQDEYDDLGKGLRRAVAGYAGVDAEEVDFSEVPRNGANGETPSRADIESSAREALKELRGTRQELEKSTKAGIGDKTFDEIRAEEKKERRKARRKPSP